MKDLKKLNMQAVLLYLILVRSYDTWKSEIDHYSNINISKTVADSYRL